MKDLRETTVNYIAGEKDASVFSADPKWIRRIIALRDQCPDEVDIYVENPDGSIMAHIPPDYVFKFKPKRKMSEKQREQCALRLQQYSERMNSHSED